MRAVQQQPGHLMADKGDAAFIVPELLQGFRPAAENRLQVTKRFRKSGQVRIPPYPDKPELKIEDCKLKICGICSALSFFKSQGYLSDAAALRKNAL